MVPIGVGIPRRGGGKGCKGEGLRSQSAGPLAHVAEHENNKWKCRRNLHNIVLNTNLKVGSLKLMGLALATGMCSRSLNTSAHTQQLQSRIQTKTCGRDHLNLGLAENLCFTAVLPALKENDGTSGKQEMETFETAARKISRLQLNHVAGTEVRNPLIPIPAVRLETDPSCLWRREN